MVSSIAQADLSSEATGAVARGIAREAARLFATQGYDATSVREVAAAAGVTKPTLYYHFGSKEGLAQALLIEPIKRLLASFRSILDTEPVPVRMAERMVEQTFAICAEDPDRSRFVHALFFGPKGSSLAVEFERQIDEVERLWRELGGKLVGAGVIDPDRAEAFVLSLRGVTILQTLLFLYRGVPIPDGLPRRLVDDLLRGFGRRRSRS